MECCVQKYKVSTLLKNERTRERRFKRKRFIRVKCSMKLETQDDVCSEKVEDNINQ